MSTTTAITGTRIFDGHDWHDQSALVIENGVVSAILPVDQLAGTEQQDLLDGGLLVPGFIDLQVNGGGGALLNDVPTLDGIRTICNAHAQFGTCALLPTLITDTPAITDKAINAGIAAYAANVPGFLGLHLEGPHLSVARKGAHDPDLIRPVEQADIDRFARASAALPNLLLTFAAETVPSDQIKTIVGNGAIVSIGHSEARRDQVNAAVDAGARMATHLFNAMSQMGNREPGLVGAVLSNGALYAGLIADGIHVDADSIGIALRAKRGPGRIFLVTDAMSLTGVADKSFTLNGRLITRTDGALRLADGTLAGADLTMIDAITFMHRTIGLSFEEALRMATLYPAQAIRIEQRFGHLQPGAIANFVHLSEDHAVRSTWIDGKTVFTAPS
ncbi:N-acetylglucosamine-6-phosphate deacetylase [Devosia rhodophyticola]|uniref:N-acetylglucosamine-6-phosphate deacetylase n=1 Tax=Devosia rhodophyticola TaxID=3026423 RepID=A0ABY7YXW8_9HYPH|nr:N-acetylglucosamine-6-phosphate deacetylase [Devosia rhodophyticola]WDR05860.1 N-acetylglucosamine-6-phosphate deacetylase [Devosia rhodophyticola]